MFQVTEKNIDDVIKNKHPLVVLNMGGNFLGTIVFNISNGNYGIAYNNSVSNKMCESTYKDKRDIIKEYMKGSFVYALQC